MVTRLLQASVFHQKMKFTPLNYLERVLLQLMEILSFKVSVSSPSVNELQLNRASPTLIHIALFGQPDCPLRIISPDQISGCRKLFTCTAGKGGIHGNGKVLSPLQPSNTPSLSLVHRTK
ncbi:hypothetical protein HNY73_014767 [Argiope bruennichi]|uniref:Uncharacterized protein n=1 Tax=Argiope bruennichi TaxID=94029 RepID=A0A8T0EQD1_ARGBR|nr:hypothetical protein HNY73_014767 [Argiope bruennichi]